MIESVLDFDSFAGVFRDIEEDKIIFFQIVSEEEERMEWLRKDIDILGFEEISIDRIDDIHRFLIQIYNIQSEKYFSSFPDDMFFFFPIDMDAIDVDHDSFSIYIIEFFGRLASFIYDIFEVLEGEFFFEFLENIESEKTESAFIQHKIMGIFGIFSWFVSDLYEILMQHILQNLILFTDFVDTKAWVRLRKMLVSDIKHNN